MTEKKEKAPKKDDQYITNDQRYFLNFVIQELGIKQRQLSRNMNFPMSYPRISGLLQDGMPNSEYKRFVDSLINILLSRDEIIHSSLERLLKDREDLKDVTKKVTN